MMIIDTDSHIIEAADLWTARMSKKKWGDSIPHVRWDEKSQMEAWFIGDRRSSVTAAIAIGAAGVDSLPVDRGGGRGPRRRGDMALLGT